MNRDGKLVFSLVIKIIVIISGLLGFSLAYLGDAYIVGASQLLYFTVQSNLAVVIFDLVAIGFIIYCLAKKDKTIPKVLLMFQQVTSVCICVTGLIFLLVLVPGFYATKGNEYEGFIPFAFSSVLLHIILPILSIFDFLMFTRGAKFKYKEGLYIVIPMVYYLCFSLIGWFCHWDYGGGRNFPYFFLNYTSPAGIFGFTDQMPYFMGSFYWILILLGLSIGLSMLFIKTCHFIDIKSNKMRYKKLKKQDSINQNNKKALSEER